MAGSLLPALRPEASESYSHFIRPVFYNDLHYVIAYDRHTAKRRLKAPGHFGRSAAVVALLGSADPCLASVGAYLSSVGAR